MVTYGDKAGRVIRIVIASDGMDIVAIHVDREIGRLSFDEFYYGKGMSSVKLLHMTVHREYQRAGIAFEMMKVAVAIHGQNFSRPPLSAIGGRHAAAEDYLTEEGAGLIQYCISQGILYADPEENETKNGEEEWEY
jgi:GNAT superfamily N-acetyltransferase